MPLVLHEPWLARMEAFYARRNRPMPLNNQKRAMLPEGAEFIDNPIGTACGFAATIEGTRFYFTPGVPWRWGLTACVAICSASRPMSGWISSGAEPRCVRSTEWGRSLGPVCPGWPVARVRGRHLACGAVGTPDAKYVEAGPPGPPSDYAWRGWQALCAT